MEEKMKIIDIHCHLIPYVDDGADSYQEALEILRESEKQGISAMIATPHYRRGMFEASTEKIRKQFARVCRIAREQGIHIHLYLGCEYYADEEMIELLARDSRFVMANSSYILVELSPDAEKSCTERKLQELVSYGYRPIIAHIERYKDIVQDLEFVRRMTESGSYIQVNADSILGMEGLAVKKICRNLIREDLVHFIGSDVHNMQKRQQHLGMCRDYMIEKYGCEYTEKIMRLNPEKLIQEYKNWGN